MFVYIIFKHFYNENDESLMKTEKFNIQATVFFAETEKDQSKI